MKKSEDKIQKVIAGRELNKFTKSTIGDLRKELEQAEIDNLF